jgi:ABC-type multidrug transport system fused ATPase/permease subunit
MNSQRKHIVLLWLFGLVGIPASLAPSQVMNYLTSIFQNRSAFEEVSVTPVVILFLVSIIFLAAMASMSMAIRGIALETVIRAKSLALFNQILRASPSFFRRNETSKVSKRIVEEVRKTEAFLMDLKVDFPVVICAVWVFGYVMFFGLNPDTPLVGQFLPLHFDQSGSAFLASIILLLSPLQAFILVFDKRLQRVRRAMAIADDTVASVSLEAFVCVREVRLHNAFPFMLKRLEQSLERLRRVEIDITKVDALFSGITPLLNGLARVITLAVGARLCVAPLELPIADITIPSIGWNDYLGFAGIAIVLDSYVGRLQNYLYRWRVAVESFRRLKEYKGTQTEFSEAVDTRPPVKGDESILFENVTLVLDEGTPVLRNISFSIRSGEKVGLVGPSGCGKSTLLGLLTAEHQATRGSVRIGSRLLSDLNFRSRANSIGFVQQKPMLINDSLRENLLLGLRGQSARMLEDKFGILDVSRLPDCRSLVDLEMELCAVIESVGLTEDILKKALDMPFPESLRDSELGRSLTELQRCLGAMNEIQQLKDGSAGSLSGESGERVLRDELLGGSPDLAAHGSQAKIDQAIQKLLVERGLLNQAVLIGLESPAGEAGSRLSGGQAMKLAIARVLLKRPDILLLDEATAALDEHSQATIVRLVETTFAKRTVITISHRLSTIRNYDRILVIDRGCLVQSGNYGELVSTPGLFRNLVRKEQGEHPLDDAFLPVSSDRQKEVVRVLAMNPLFGQLGITDLEQVASLVSTETLAEGEILFRRGEPSEAFYLILDGNIEFFSPKSNGESEVVARYGLGRSFGEFGVFGQMNRALGARASTATKLGVIDKEEIQNLIAVRPEIALIFLRSTSRQVGELLDLACVRDFGGGNG